MAATNRPDILDPALIRPGRFDRQVSVAYPDRDGRAAILALHAAGKPLDAGVDLAELAKLTRGFSGADLANVLNEAALLAARVGSDSITMAMVEEGIDRAELGVASRRTIMSEEERRVVAFHEAGHALAALSVEGGAMPHKLTIVPRAASLGHCSLVDSHDRVLPSRSFLEGEITVLLGGRVAEEMIFGDPTTGASSDLRRASEMARSMVCEYGMSAELGPQVLASGQPLSDDVERTVSREIKRILDEGYARAHQALVKAQSALDRVAEALLEKESLTAGEVEALVSTVPLPPSLPPARPDESLPAGGPSSYPAPFGGTGPGSSRP